MSDPQLPGVLDNGKDWFAELDPPSSPEPPVQQQQKKKKRIPLTDGHRRLRVIATFLVIALLAAVAVIGVLVSAYKEQNKALTQCYATADALTQWTAAAYYTNEGDSVSAGIAARQAMEALEPLGQDSAFQAMSSCRAQFYGLPLR